MENYINSQVFFLCPKRSWTVGVLQSWDGAKGEGSCKSVDEGDVLDKLKQDSIHPVREGALEEDVDDLLNLTELHDATLLQCLKRRYMRDVIYTNIGSIVVALNPFNFKIPRYMPDAMPKYLSEGDVIERNLPHSWACAHNTFHEMKNTNQNQSVIVSGESGAGKTEASKIVMKYLAAVSSKSQQGAGESAGDIVGKKINLSSPPLEAFGNAKTVRNDNSSRFGKFMKVKFSPKGDLLGAHITKYLLEKSRIVTAAKGERIYHAFYILLHSSRRTTYFLDEDKTYKSANAGSTLNNKEFDTDADFKEVCDAMEAVGLSNGEIDSLWKVVAGILHFENIQFIAEGEGCSVDPKSEGALAKGTQLWSIDATGYKAELKETTLMIMGKPVKKLLSSAAAGDARSALNKTMYDMAFAWLVDKCNQMLDVEGSDSGNWIGLLDIFGFEDFEVNSFEQLCINLTNEALQNHYNTYIFCKDLEECRAEGIDVADVPFPDNGPCLAMISGQGGVLSLLDQECQLGSGTDMGFFSSIKGKFEKHPFFMVKKTAQDSFIIHHYAGSVSYKVQDFRAKNLDTLKDAWKILVRNSTDVLIKELLPEPVEVRGAKPTVGGFFKKQLSELMDLLNSTNPHWIRCVKPHPAKKPLMWDGVSVMKQLSSSGVLGTVKIRKAGYAVRMPHATFAANYKIVAKSKGCAPDPAGIIKACGYGKTEAQIGKKRVFLRSHIYNDIEVKKKTALSGSAIIVQSFALRIRAYTSAQEHASSGYRDIIESLRDGVKTMLAMQLNEDEARREIAATRIKNIDGMKTAERQGYAATRKAEEDKAALIFEKMKQKWMAELRDLTEEEEKYRDPVFRMANEAWAELLSKAAHSYNHANELTARREYKESEQALLADRRAAREERRQKRLNSMLENCSGRLAPTLQREDRNLRFVQCKKQEINKKVEHVEVNAEHESERRLHVAASHEKAQIEKFIKYEKYKSRLHKVAEAQTKMKIAEERLFRLMHEDFEWQKMETQLFEGQKKALEEERRAFILDKSRQETERRAALRRQENELLQRKALEYEKEKILINETKKEMEELKWKKNNETLKMQRMHREQAAMREKAAAFEQDVAFQNNRKERMILQRPDLPRKEIEELPLSVRVGPPAPVMMVNQSPIVHRAWAPFKVLKMEVSPSNGVVQGEQFQVSFITTRFAPKSYITVQSGVGEIARYKVRAAHGDCQFKAPSDWFSELEVSFTIGEEIQATKAIARVAQHE